MVKRVSVFITTIPQMFLRTLLRFHVFYILPNNRGHNIRHKLVSRRLHVQPSDRSKLQDGGRIFKINTTYNGDNSL